MLFAARIIDPHRVDADRFFQAVPVFKLGHAFVFRHNISSFGVLIPLYVFRRFVCGGRAQNPPKAKRPRPFLGKEARLPCSGDIPEQLQKELFLGAVQRGPAVQQLPLVRGKAHGLLALGEKLREGDAEPGADLFQAGEGGDLRPAVPGGDG